MSKKRKVLGITMAISVALAIVIAFLSSTDLIHKDINIQMDVDIYSSNGVKVGTTSINFCGMYYPHLLGKDIFRGNISIPEIPKLEQDDTKVEIIWNDTHSGQISIYTKDRNSITFVEDIGSSYIYINHDMNEIAWWTEELGVIASSYDAYSNSLLFEK